MPAQRRKRMIATILNGLSLSHDFCRPQRVHIFRRWHRICGPRDSATGFCGHGCRVPRTLATGTALSWTHHSTRRGCFPPLYCNAKSCWFQVSFGTEKKVRPIREPRHTRLERHMHPGTSGASDSANRNGSCSLSEHRSQRSDPSNHVVQDSLE